LKTSSQSPHCLSITQPFGKALLQFLASLSNDLEMDHQRFSQVDLVLHPGAKISKVMLSPGKMAGGNAGSLVK
jgi:hypothetical protein